jgi:hypothetical protein
VWHSTWLTGTNSEQWLRGKLIAGSSIWNINSLSSSCSIDHTGNRENKKHRNNVGEYNMLYIRPYYTPPGCLGLESQIMSAAKRIERRGKEQTQLANHP